MKSVENTIEAEAKSLFSWDWHAFALVAISSIPIPFVALYNAKFALAMVIGLIPAVFASIGPTRRSRVRILVLGTVVPASLLVGSALSAYTNRWIASIALALFALVTAFMLTRGRPLWLALITPVVGLGLSFADTQVTLGFALIMLAESVLAFGVSQLFPQRAQQAAAVKTPSLPAAQAKEFGVLYALALAVSTFVSWGWDHMGWVVGSAALVMRPSKTMQGFRSLWRIASILVGLIIVSAFLLMQPSSIVAALFTVAVLVVCAGFNRSRAYIMPLFMTICVFMLIEYPITGTEEVWLRFIQRLVEVGLGIAIAYVMGLVVPLIIHWIQKRRIKKTP